MIDEDVLNDIDNELFLARNKHSHFKNYHEGYAVLLEEVDELWGEIKKVKHFNDQHDKTKIRKEAIQVATMAIRFIEDLCE